MWIQQQHYFGAYGIILIIFSFIAIFVMFGSSSLTSSISENIIEERFGKCQIYKCTKERSRLAIVIPYRSSDVNRVITLMDGIYRNSTNTKHAHMIDLYIYQLDQTKNDEELFLKVNCSIKIKKDLFATQTVMKPVGNFDKYESILLYLMANPNLLPNHCFLQYLSLHTRILDKGWLDAIVSHSIHSFDQNFWLKGPIDTAVRPFTKFERIEFSLYSIYAIHSSCLVDLFNLAQEIHPEWRLNKAITDFIRDPNDVRLAHRLTPRIIPTTIGVNLRNTRITIGDLRSRFPDTYYAECSRIIG